MDTFYIYDYISINHKDIKSSVKFCFASFDSLRSSTTLIIQINAPKSHALQRELK